MDAARMESRLRAFYAEHNPGNEQNIAEIVRKFQGREQQLCAKLFKKYGVAPVLTLEDEEQPKKPVQTVAYERHFKAYGLVPATDSPLDLRSATFDALKALQTPKKRLHLPVAAYPLDNIQKCRHLLPEADPHRQTLVARPKKASPAAKPEVKRTVAATPSLFEQLADTYLDGPFQVLRRCFLERRRVLVVVRRINSVRGTCVGFLKAFDKHMNLVLLDVSQEFVPPATHERVQREVREGKRAPVDAVVSVADRRRNRDKLRSAGGTQREFNKQLFIRGDNVVSVSAVDSSAAAGGAAKRSVQR